MNADAEVREIIHRGFITSVFQPIVDLETGIFTGFEALMRGPKGTLLESPLQIFGPRSPLSAETLVALDLACMSAALRSGHLLAAKAKLFINIEMETLLQPQTRLSAYEQLLKSSGVDPRQVVLELSERSTPQDPVQIAGILKYLRESFGFRLALDDLGSAYSGLQHLLWFEPDFVKLDMELVKGLSHSPRKQTIVHHLAHMAQDLGCAVVAEGVDNQEDLLPLMEDGVLLAQGYHFGWPQDAFYWRMDADHPEGFQPWYQDEAPASPTGATQVQGLRSRG